jgi:hypothetical protein
MARVNRFYKESFVMKSFVLPCLPAAAVLSAQTFTEYVVPAYSAKMRRADVRKVAAPKQNPRAFGCDQFGRVTFPQMIERPTAVAERRIGHTIAGMQRAGRDSQGQGTRPVMPGERRVKMLSHRFSGSGFPQFASTGSQILI